MGTSSYIGLPETLGHTKTERKGMSVDCETLAIALPRDDKLVGRGAEALAVYLGPEGVKGIHLSDRNDLHGLPGWIMNSSSTPRDWVIDFVRLPDSALVPRFPTKRAIQP